MSTLFVILLLFVLFLQDFWPPRKQNRGAAPPGPPACGTSTSEPQPGRGVGVRAEHKNGWNVSQPSILTREEYYTPLKPCKNNTNSSKIRKLGKKWRECDDIPKSVRIYRNHFRYMDTPPKFLTQTCLVTWMSLPFPFGYGNCYCKHV